MLGDKGYNSDANRAYFERRGHRLDVPDEVKPRGAADDRHGSLHHTYLHRAFLQQDQAFTPLGDPL
jgi:hypothetical protein